MRIFLIIAASFFLTLGAGGFHEASASPVGIKSLAPSASISMQSETALVVTFKFPKKLRANSAVLTVERRRDTTKLPSYKFTLQKKAASFSFSDKALAPGTYSYRGRIRLGKENSKWSVSRVVVIEDPDFEEGTPTPTPTATPGEELPPPQKPELPQGYSECANAEERALALTLVNAARVAEGATPLIQHDYLYFASVAHSILMANLQEPTHDGFFENEISQYQIPGLIFGQNIAWTIATPEQVVAGWMESRDHRSNILRPSFSRMGIACIADNAGKRWWTQVFSGG